MVFVGDKMNNKAQNPIIGVILMIVIGIAIAATVYVWVSGMVSSPLPTNLPGFIDQGDGDYSYRYSFERNESGTIYWVTGDSISLQKCNNEKYISPDLAKEEFIGYEVMLHINTTTEMYHYSGDGNCGVGGDRVYGWPEEQIVSYEVTGINNNYRSDYLQMSQFSKINITSTNISVDFSKAIDEHGAGVYTMRNTSLSFTNPTNTSTSFTNGNFSGIVYIQFGIPKEFGDKFQIWFSEPTLNLSAIETKTYNLKVIQYGTGPGIYEQGIYDIPINIICNTNNLMVSGSRTETKIGSSILRLKFGEV